MPVGRLFVIRLPGLVTEAAVRTARFPNSVIDLRTGPADDGAWRMVGLARGIPLPAIHGETEVRVVKGRELGSWHEVQELLREVRHVAPLAPLPRTR